MKNGLEEFGAYFLVLLAIVAVSGPATVPVRRDRSFDVAGVNDVASTDNAVHARGDYSAYGPAHCAYCHTTEDKWKRLDAGERVPMSGGFVFDIGIAKLATPNLTPDKETGIGNISDGKIARMLRHNVRSSGVAAVPFMEFQNM